MDVCPEKSIKTSPICQVCGNVSFSDEGDGFLYCNVCNSQAEHYIETGTDGDEIFGNIEQAFYARKYARNPVRDEPRLSQLSRMIEDGEDRGDIGAVDGDGPTGPSDFASTPSTLSYDDYYSEIRSRYLKGFQIMIQLQIKALVEKFNVSPLIVGLVGPIWLRFLAVTRIMADEWADEVIHDSESQRQGEADNFHPYPKHRMEPHSMFGQRAVTLWHRSLCSTIPLSYSLVISFLVCHIARESILPTDIIKWSLEGKLPYFTAFIEIEKQLGYPSSACPISSSRMFRPTKIISLQNLEALAASVAQKIGLELPPVNFHGIASRFLIQLSIPVNNILRQACRIYEWSMPPDLFLLANNARLPTRVSVMAILIVTIRILYDINGSGKWEKSLSTSRSSSSVEGNVEKHVNCTFPTDDDVENLSSLYENISDDENLELDTIALLKMLEAKFSDIGDRHDYKEDLSSYLKYCKDVVFSGSSPSFEDQEEEQIIRDLWDFYQEKSVKQLEDQEMYSQCRDLSENKSIFGRNNMPKESKDRGDPECTSTWSHDASECRLRDEALRQLKLDMEENRFSYIPPSRQMKKMGYFFYSRKRIDGSYVYACHADYYILLRACARVAQVDLRILHLGVMKLERRLKHLEERINRCFRIKTLNNNHDSPPDDVEENHIGESLVFPKDVN